MLSPALKNSGSGELCNSAPFCYNTRMIDLQSSATAVNGRAGTISKIATNRPRHSPSPWGDLSRLGNGERNLAEPKAARPSKRARASQRRNEGGLLTDSFRSPCVALGRQNQAPRPSSIIFCKSVPPPKQKFYPLQTTPCGRLCQPTLGYASVFTPPGGAYVVPRRSFGAGKYAQSKFCETNPFQSQTKPF